MEIVIGVNPDDAGQDALALGSLLSRSLSADPVLAHVHPASYDFVSRGHIDAEWEKYLSDNTAAILQEAHERFTRQYGWAEAATVIGAHRSSGQGLADIAAERGSELIVIGSAPGGSSGRFVIGSTADKLLHGSEVPIALAPAGYRRGRIDRIGRVVVAFQDTPESRSGVSIGARYAERMGVPLTVMTVVIRHRLYGSRLGADSEGAVLAQEREQVAAAQASALQDAAAAVPTTTELTVGDTPLSALQRLAWQGDELLVLGSAAGHLKRVFLGDMTYKLLRATPVPALVLPRKT